MSDTKSTRELPNDHRYFSINCDGFPNLRNGVPIIEARVNSRNEDIVTVEVGGFAITTVRATWAAVIGALVDIIGAQNIEITVPAKTFRIEFDDTNLEAKVVAQ